MNLIPGDTINIQNPEFPVVIVLLSGDEIEVAKANKNIAYKKRWSYLENSGELINTGENKIELVQVEVLNSIELD